MLGDIRSMKSMRKGIKAHRYSLASCTAVLNGADAGDVRGWISRRSAPFFHTSQDGLGCRPLASIARTFAMRSWIVEREKKKMSEMISKILT